MKKVILLVIPIITLSCGQKSNEQLSDQQKAKLGEEIRPVISQILESAKQTNAERVLDSFWDSDEFVYVSEAGESFDYSKFALIVKQNYADLKSEVFTKGTEKFTFINEAAVLWTYIGSVTLSFKNGGELKVEPFAITMLFRKLNGKWKVSYLHESGQLPIQTDTTKPK